MHLLLSKSNQPFRKTRRVFCGLSHPVANGLCRIIYLPLLESSLDATHVHSGIVAAWAGLSLVHMILTYHVVDLNQTL